MLKSVAGIKNQLLFTFHQVVVVVIASYLAFCDVVIFIYDIFSVITVDLTRSVSIFSVRVHMILILSDE